jgi:hypothetical protein
MVVITWVLVLLLKQEDCEEMSCLKLLHGGSVPSLPTSLENMVMRK